MILEGKVALVTGSTSGIGLAIARTLASEGAKVMLNGFGDAAEIETIKAELGALHDGADLSDPAQIEAMIHRCTKELGAPDILVNNAGIQHVSPVESFPPEKWDAIIAINLTAVFHTTRLAIPSMKQKKWGRILTIQSVSVKQPVPGLLLSNAVRPGTGGLVKTLSDDLGKHNITINVVCPGKIMTDRFLSGVKQSGLSKEEYLARGAQDVPLGRIGTPDEFANVMVFLASERASYVTGVALQVDGGLIRSNV